MQLMIGDRVAHFKTGRSGVIRFLGSNGMMIIFFDDGREEWRRRAAFRKVTD